MEYLGLCMLFSLPLTKTVNGDCIVVGNDVSKPQLVTSLEYMLEYRDEGLIYSEMGLHLMCDISM